MEDNMNCPVCNEWNPYSAKACRKCGQSLKEAKEKEMQTWLEAVRATPNDMQAHYRLGWAYHQLDNFSKAAREIETSINLSKDLPNLWPYWFLANVYTDRDRWSDAVQTLSHGIVEKLDKFREGGQISGLDECDELLRDSYYNGKIFHFNRGNTSANKAYRQGLAKSIREQGFITEQGLADVEGFYRHHVRPEIGTYELAKQLRESKSRKSAVKTNSTVKVLAIVALLLIICLCLFMLVLN